MRKNYCKNCGKEITQRAKRCRSCANKGEGNPMFGKVGTFNHMFGKKHTIVARQKISEAGRNRSVSEKTRQKISSVTVGKNNGMFGKKHTEEARRKISLVKKGKPSPKKGKSVSEEQKLKISKTLKGKYAGENHPNWQGGISCEPYCPIWKDKEYKKALREDRDCNICWDIGYWWKGGSSIHHINYDKKDCAMKNLITVSIGMNSAANKDREWHTEWFQIAMSRRLGYNYG